jgi:hypothetical protein|tara:strand:- start:1188 stop:1505 length:318 start_codon:yes stop_codon:yes gene_type:complete
MASGRLGANDVAAATYTTVYTCPADTFAVVSINFLNRGNASCFVRLAVADAATPTAGEFLEYDTELTAKSVLERTGLVLSAGQLLVVYSNIANISAVTFGIETAA